MLLSTLRQTTAFLWYGTFLCLTTIWGPVKTLQADDSDVRQAPPSRFFYNDDGDRAVFLARGPFHIRQFHHSVDVLVGTGVTTLVYCANFGSDQAYYPSRVASSLGWREVENTRRNPRYTYFNRVREVGELLRKQKIDLLGTVMRRAEEQGLEFVPSLRMNDTHFLNKVPPEEHPLTGEFWLNNRDLTIDGGALDFSHEKVRDYRNAQIAELITGYATDGIELDFSRQPTLFAPGSGRDKQNLITEMVEQCRWQLDQKNKQDGKRRFLIVRVPHTLELCQYYGFDIGGWMMANLVDYVVLASPDRYFQFDIPLTSFLELATRTHSKCRLIASPDSYAATPSMYRAGTANYYTMGQQDTYLFNFFTARSEPREYYPFQDEDYALLRDLKSPVTLWSRPKHFLSDGWFPGRSVTLEDAAQQYEIHLYVGDDLIRYQQDHTLKQAHLQIAFTQRHPDDEFEVSLNGQVLPHEQADFQENVYRFKLREILPKLGHNTISIRVMKLASQARPIVSRVELLTEYDIRGILPDSEAGPHNSDPG